MFSVKLTKDGQESWLDYVQAKSKAEAMKNAEEFFGHGWKSVSAFKHKK